MGENQSPSHNTQFPFYQPSSSWQSKPRQTVVTSLPLSHTPTFQQQDRRAELWDEEATTADSRHQTAVIHQKCHHRRISISIIGPML
ncbi:Hypothetical predicted protein [Scomber scombrus]|uniref:Uncharacterized protein n=1 Tax=Scomber scombrus TaxID=13677 RepID=A0AAV1NL45_SCOSC